MTPIDVKNYFGSTYQFHKKTGMSASTLTNWIKWGFIPIPSQEVIEELTNGALKTFWHRKEE